MPANFARFPLKTFMKWNTWVLKTPSNPLCCIHSTPLMSLVVQYVISPIIPRYKRGRYQITAKRPLSLSHIWIYLYLSPSSIWFLNCFPCVSDISSIFLLHPRGSVYRARESNVEIKKNVTATMWLIRKKEKKKKNRWVGLIHKIRVV